MFGFSFTARHFTQELQLPTTETMILKTRNRSLLSDVWSASMATDWGHLHESMKRWIQRAGWGGPGVAFHRRCSLA